MPTCKMPIPRRRVPSLLEFQARDQYESRHEKEEHAEEIKSTHAKRTSNTTIKALEVGEYEEEQVLEHGGRPKDWNGNVVGDGSQRTRPANSRKGRGTFVAHVVCLILSALHGERPATPRSRYGATAPARALHRSAGCAQRARTGNPHTAALRAR